MMIESDYLSQLETDNDRAQTEMREFLRGEVDRIMGLITKGVKERNIHIEDDRITSIRALLENPTTVEINEPEFSIHRNLSNGFDFRLNNQHQRAA